MNLILQHEPGKKTWLAEIKGRDRQFGFKRDFVGAYGGKPTGPGPAIYLIDAGAIYEACEADQRRFFLMHESGEVEMTRDQVADWFDALTLGRRKKRQAAEKKRQEEAQRVTDDVDARIARFNSEGGFSAN